MDGFFFQVFFACSVLGTVFYGYFFAFHLLHISELNQLLKRVIAAVTTNGKKLQDTSDYFCCWQNTLGSCDQEKH